MGRRRNGCAGIAPLSEDTRSACPRHACALAVAICASSANSQTFTTLIRFTGTGGTASGANPDGSLIDSGGTLFGMTFGGGANGRGNVFSVGMNGTNYQNLVSFTYSSGTAMGKYPEGSLIASGSTLYGMTSGGGDAYPGNIFSVGVNGTNYQNLISFTDSSGTAIGAYPFGNLIASDSTFFGMTNQGGAHFVGTVFSVGTNGTSFQSLVSFTGTSGTASGQEPPGQLDRQRRHAFRHDVVRRRERRRERVQRGYERHQLPKPGFLHRHRRHCQRQGACWQLDRQRQLRFTA